MLSEVLEKQLTIFPSDTGYRAVPEVPKGEDDYGAKYAELPHCPAFKQIGDLRGPFDLGLIPIGAYEPRFIMSSMHANPFDSVNIFKDTRCKRALGMHWGRSLDLFKGSFTNINARYLGFDGRRCPGTSEEVEGGSFEQRYFRRGRL